MLLYPPEQEPLELKLQFVPAPQFWEAAPLQATVAAHRANRRKRAGLRRVFVAW